YDIPEVVMVLTSGGTLFLLGTAKKLAFLAPLSSPPEGSALTVRLLQRSKEDGNAANFRAILDECGGEGVAVLKKDSNASAFMDTWTAALAESGELGDATPGISGFLAVKTSAELEVVKKAGVLTNKILKQAFVPEMEAVIDEGRKVTHEKLAEKVNGVIEDPMKIKIKVAKDDVEACFFPIIQSGGSYDVKVSATSNTEVMKFDAIICSIGARYQNYCTSMTRTYLVDPPQKVSDTYKLLTETHDACLAVMKPGNTLSQVYEEASA
ncbi:hypothetical protein TeGR_g14022, partial [Tetraparma gracilis]